MSPEERIHAFNRHKAKDGFLSHDGEEVGRVMGKERLRWLVGDYEAGDVVFHKLHMIHGATKNKGDLGRIRLASDLRFYEEDQRWMNILRYDGGMWGFLFCCCSWITCFFRLRFDHGTRGGRTTKEYGLNHPQLLRSPPIRLLLVASKTRKRSPLPR